MAFNSLTFFLFLPIVYLIFYFTADRLRWIVLLLASYAFYATLLAPHLLLILFSITTLSYLFGWWIDNAIEDERRKRVFWFGIIICLSPLGILKILPPLLDTSSPYSFFLISVGISYFIFQALSYLIDIYLDIEKHESHFGYFALYLAFFPKLLQGPIERTRDLIPQIKKEYKFDYNLMRSGLLLFVIGLFKKVVIADRLGFFSDLVFDDVHNFFGWQLLFAIYIYAAQIYFDFSGYTDMARGGARLFGINLTENFKKPYSATSIAEFWRRWHISFSRWILDYIFKPIQMAWRDYGHRGTALALLITFLISGLWHGMSWGFLVWGGLHGSFLAVSIFYHPIQKKIHKKLGLSKSRILKIWQTFITFHLVCFAWIFFRSNSISDAFTVILNIFPLGAIESINKLFVNGKVEILIPFGGIVCLATFPFISKFLIKNRSYFDLPLALRWAGYMAISIALMLFNSSSKSNFIYNSF